jgi:hypothetical protein
VEANAASQVFHNVGMNTLGYCLSAYIGDTSSLRHRGFMQVLLISSYIITSWLAGPIHSSFFNGSRWRWANFSFVILMLTVGTGILAAASEQRYFAITNAFLNLFIFRGTAIWLYNFFCYLARHIALKAIFTSSSRDPRKFTTIFGSI